MADVEKLGIEINAILKELGSMRQLAEDLKRIKENAGLADEKVAQFQKRVEKMRNLRESFQSLNLVGAQMMAMSGGILYGFKKLATGFIDAASETEQYELTLTTLFKSAAKAKEELAWAEEFEIMTPYALQDIIKSTVLFRSFGLDARKYLGMAGDMAATMGKPLEDAAYGVAKAMASGAAGMQVLTQSFGITGDKLRKFGWRGKGDLEGFRKALEKYLVTMYGGGMAAQSRMFKAYIEGFEGFIFKFKTLVGKPLLEAITPDIAKIYDEIKKLFVSGEIQKWAVVVKDIFLGIYGVIKDTIGIMAKFIKPLFEFLEKNPEVAKAAGKWLFLGSALAFLAGSGLVLTGILGQVVVSILQLRLTLLKLPGVAGQAFGGMNKNILGLFNNITSLKTAFGTLGSSLTSIGAIGASAFIGWQIGRLIGELTGLDKIVQDFFGNLIYGKERWEAVKRGGKPLLDVRAEDLKTLRELKKARAEVFAPEVGLLEYEKKWGAAAIHTELFLDAEKIRKETELLFHKTEVSTEEFVHREAFLVRQLALEINEQMKSFGLTTELKGYFKTYFGVEPADIAEAQKELKKILPSIKFEIPAPPSPGDLGLTTPYDITADTRPQIDNYYYTIHFERDAVQINTLEITPEKFARAFKEFLSRQALGPVMP